MTYYLIADITPNRATVRHVADHQDDVGIRYLLPADTDYRVVQLDREAAVGDRIWLSWIDSLEI